MSNPPAFQMYASDYYLDTNSWTVDEIGIYQRLLLTEWVNGGLPNDEVRLARIAGCSLKKFQKGWRIIKFKFTQNGDNLLVNKRLENVREQQAKYKELQSEKGKLSAEKRWKDHITVVKKRLQPKDNTSSSTSSSTSNNKKNIILTDEEFLEGLKKDFFWVDFEREMVKINAWLKVNPTRKMTRRFLVRWISKIEKPMQTKAVGQDISYPDAKQPSWIHEALERGWK